MDTLCDVHSGWPAAAYALIGREDIAATLVASAPHLTSTQPRTAAHLSNATLPLQPQPGTAMPLFGPPHDLRQLSPPGAATTGTADKPFGFELRLQQPMFAASPGHAGALFQETPVAAAVPASAFGNMSGLAGAVVQGWNGPGAARQTVSGGALTGSSGTVLDPEVDGCADGSFWASAFDGGGNSRTRRNKQSWYVWDA